MPVSIFCKCKVVDAKKIRVTTSLTAGIVDMDRSSPH